jgi:hypothetical protein
MGCFRYSISKGFTKRSAIYSRGLSGDYFAWDSLTHHLALPVTGKPAIALIQPEIDFIQPAQ